MWHVGVVRPQPCGFCHSEQPAARRRVNYLIKHEGERRLVVSNTAHSVRACVPLALSALSRSSSPARKCTGDIRPYLFRFVLNDVGSRKSMYGYFLPSMVSSCRVVCEKSSWLSESRWVCPVVLCPSLFCAFSFSTPKMAH